MSMSPMIDGNSLSGAMPGNREAASAQKLIQLRRLHTAAVLERELNSRSPEQIPVATSHICGSSSSVELGRSSLIDRVTLGGMALERKRILLLERERRLALEMAAIDDTASRRAAALFQIRQNSLASLLAPRTDDSADISSLLTSIGGGVGLLSRSSALPPLALIDRGRLHDNIPTGISGLFPCPIGANTSQLAGLDVGARVPLLNERLGAPPASSEIGRKIELSVKNVPSSDVPSDAPRPPSPQLSPLQQKRVPLLDKRPLPRGYQPSPSSVIIGKGRVPRQAPGNALLRKHVAELVDLYASGAKKVKTKCVSSVFCTTRRNCGPHEGAFVRLEEDGLWYEVSDCHARDKITAAFRDALGHKYKSSTQAKVAKRRALKNSFRSVADEDENQANDTSKDDAIGGSREEDEDSRK